MIEYKLTKDFETEQIRELFSSVGWFSGNFPEKLKTALANSGRVISAWDGDRLVGLVRGFDDGIWQATIDCLLVAPSHQGKGIGSALLKRLLEEYSDIMYINVVPEEKRNAAFYRRNGFEVMEEATPMQVIGKLWE
ncbi:MAG: GNAT family N-acetyltransferase [Oscillospiraceae bacterium]